MTDVKRLLSEATSLPWHRHTYGHASIEDLVGLVRRDLAAGETPSTDATWIHDDDTDEASPVVAFVGNGPKQEKNAALIVYAVNHLHGYEAVVEALAEWVAAEDELPLDGFGDDATKGVAWMHRVEEARKRAAGTLARLRGTVPA